MSDGVDPEILEIVGKLDLSTPDRMASFARWKDEDGSLDGLRRISQSPSTKRSGPLRILSLGGGQQSTAIYLMAANGHEGIAPLDYAIFADTGEEPNWVYENLAHLQEYRTPEGNPGAPILIRALQDENGNAVSLGDNLLEGNAGRFASIPAFIKHPDLYERNGKNAQGKGRRQCTREFKIAVVEQTIRREILGLEPKARFKGERVTQVFGFDCKEGTRIVNTKTRLAEGSMSVGDFPLWDLQWERGDCVSYLKELPGWGHEVFPSACTFCPLVKNDFRRMVRDRDPEGWKRACQVDAGMRRPGAAASKMLDGELYIHRSMKPLADVDIDLDDRKVQAPTLFSDCEGFCGH